MDIAGQRIFNGAAAVCRALQENGVDVVFGIPGTHNLELYRWLDLSGIRHVLLRHEQGLGYAADGYARASGRPAVCITTSGPGLTNILTAMATAYADSIPMLVVAPGVSRGQERADAGRLHEMKDQRGVVQGLTDVAIRATSVEHAVTSIHTAFARWSNTRPRPVYIEIPLDLLDEVVLESDYPTRPHREIRLFDSTTPTLVAEAIGAAKRVVVLAGGGARGASEAIEGIADRVGAGVITSVNGKGILDELSPWSLGASLRLSAVQSYLESSDLAVLVGTELGDSDLWGHKMVFRGDVVRIDIDSNQLHKNARATLAVQADAPHLMASVAGIVEKRTPDELTQAYKEVQSIREEAQSQALVDAGRLAEVNAILRSTLPADSILAGDSSQVSYFGSVHFFPIASQGRFLYPCGFATLGYALPAAIGAKIAFEARPVVALLGDGAFYFTATELSSVRDLNLGIVIIVVNNHGFEEIRGEMSQRGIGPFGVEWHEADLVKLGEAFGIEGHRARSGKELEGLVSKAVGSDVAILIEVDLREFDH